MSKKTFNVEKFVTTINEFLQESTCGPDVRRGMIVSIETVLHETDNYGGFRYLSSQDLPDGVLPGVRYDSNGNLLPYPDRFIDTDDTRRRYYL